MYWGKENISDQLFDKGENPNITSTRLEENKIHNFIIMAFTAVLTILLLIFLSKKVSHYTKLLTACFIK